MNLFHRLQYEISNPAPVGQRHSQAMKVAGSMARSGMAPSAIAAQLKAMHNPPLPDREIDQIVHYLAQKNHPKPSHFGLTTNSLRAVCPDQKIRNFIRSSSVEGLSCDDLEVALWEASPWRPSENWKLDSLMFLAGCYDRNDLINIVTDYEPEIRINGIQKGKPKGYGMTKSRDEWICHIRDHSTPESEAGAWIRMNPTDGKGISDANITSFRYALLECDSIPLELQLGLFCRLPLPIIALITSGSRSVHAMVHVGVPNAEAYRTTVNRIVDLLKPFGIDCNNKNPSRMSRLPGVTRTIGGGADNRQRLLYFHPDRKTQEPIL